MGFDRKQLVEKTLEVLRYKIAKLPTYEGEAKVYKMGQIDGLILVARAMAQGDELMELMNLELKIQESVRQV